MSSRFYITTPIYYPNGEPHLGHLYTTVCADVVARYHRLRGDDTFFLTGTDEHGQKMVKSATEAGTTPEALSESMSLTFRDAWSEFGISNDDFIRTTEPRHKKRVQAFVDQMLRAGDIYLGAYEGWYDEGQEEFVSESEAKAADYKSVISSRPLVRYSEPTYFLRLLKYRDRLIDVIERDELLIRPAHRKSEILNVIRGWESDLSISRASLKWGIELPNDPSHVLYVWIDALSNYVTALGYPELPDGSDASRYKRFWPVDVHLIGREILRPHAFYWPVMLMSLQLPLPRAIFAHGWWTSEGKKMSKSMGNFVDLAKLRALCSTYGNDALRFYMLRAAPFGADLDFAKSEFDNAYNEIRNVLGNLLNRSLAMTWKYRQGRMPPYVTTGPEDSAVLKLLEALPAQLEDAYRGLELQRCATLPLELARAANSYIDITRPFSIAKEASQAGRLSSVLHLCLRAVRASLAALVPVMPEIATRGLAQLNNPIAPGTSLDEYLAKLPPSGHQLGEASPLIPQIEPT